MEASALSHPVGLTRVSLAGPLLRLRTDDQLVALFRAGHDEAFGTIHDRYRARLFAYARQMLGGSRSDAEDVLQDVFLRAYHALRADRRQVALRAWLYRVAHNRCIDQLRRPSPAAEDIYDVNRGSTDEQPAEAFERREDLRRLIADVRALPEQQRSALLMREMEGLSYNDLAEALGVTVPAIKSLLVRARIGLVEAVEARDTACVEIRDDLVSAFDRGVRVSGRAKKHLRECAGCRDYRTALRGVEKSLNGLAPSHGPLTLIAKLLGLGGAGSGGGAFALGGGGAAAGAGGATVGTAAVTTGGVATIGGGAVATKVAAVVAAAAVVGGGAATVKKVEHAVKPASHHAHAVVRSATPAAAAAAMPTAAEAQKTARDGASAKAVRHSALSRSGGHEGAASTTHAASATRMAATADTASTDSAPALEPTSGGLEAPADTADTTPTDPGGSGTATSDTTAAGTPTGAGSTATSPTDQAAAGTGSTATGTTTPSTASTSPTAGTATTGAPTAPSSSTTPGGAAAPSGASTPTTSGPIAQGASAPPAG